MEIITFILFQFQFWLSDFKMLWSYCIYVEEDQGQNLYIYIYVIYLYILYIYIYIHIQYILFAFSALSSKHHTPKKCFSMQTKTNQMQIHCSLLYCPDAGPGVCKPSSALRSRVSLSFQWCIETVCVRGVLSVDCPVCICCLSYFSFAEEICPTKRDWG